MERYYLKTRLFLLAGSAICFAVLLFSVSTAFKRQENGPLAPDPAASSRMKANIQIRDFSFIRTYDGNNEWRIQAAQAEVFEDQQFVWMKDLQVQYESPKGWELSFFGEHGRLDTQTHDFELLTDQDALEMVVNRNYKIFAKSIRWVDHRQTILSSDPVVIEGPSIRIRGLGMEASLAQQELRVLSDVHADFF